jgi:hypothetical protein
MSTHAGLGRWLGVQPFLLVILSFVGRLPAANKWLAGSLFGVCILQAEVIAAIRHAVPVLAALHPVLALVLFATSILVVQRAVAPCASRPRSTQLLNRTGMRRWESDARANGQRCGSGIALK